MPHPTAAGQGGPANVPGASSAASGTGSDDSAGRGQSTDTTTGGEQGPDTDARLEALGELAERGLLSAPLVDAIGDLKATAPVLDGPKAHERKPVRNVARRYKNGERDLYLEIIDTAQAPELRANVIKILTDPAALDVPVRQASELAGSSAVVTGFPQARASGVVALLNGRYFVNARLEGSDDMEEALRLLQGMDWSRLMARDEGSAGSGAR